MALNITTYHGQPLTSDMLNQKVREITGNIILRGFDVTKKSPQSLGVTPGECIINGAIISEDTERNVAIPTNLQGDLFVIAIYNHSIGTFEIVVTGDSTLTNSKLLLAKVNSDTVTLEEKTRTLIDLSSSLKSLKDSLLSEQELKYEGEVITCNESVAGATSDMIIKGQSVLNVAPIKEATDITAELSGTGTSITFSNTEEGYVDGVTIEGKTYQNIVSHGNVEQAGSAIARMSTVGSVTTFNFESDGSGVIVFKTGALLKDNTTYTALFDIDTNLATPVISFRATSFTDGLKDVGKQVGNIKIKISTAARNTGVVIGVHGGSNNGKYLKVSNFVLLEGDHTANTELPAYFEGIVGVGDKGKNLYNKNNIILETGVNIDTGELQKNGGGYNTSLFIDVKRGSTYQRTSGQTWYGYDKDGKYVSAYTGQVLENTSYDKLRIVCSNGSQDIQQIEEGSVSTAHEPYIDGVAIETYSTGGKNIFRGGWIKGTINTDTGIAENHNTHVMSEYPISVKPSTTYFLSNNGEYRDSQINEYDSSMRFIGFRGISNLGVYQSTANAAFINVHGNPENRDKYQIEEGSAATAHEPYKEDRVQTILRSPLMSLSGGVKDEIVDGTVVRRVGKVILDGSEAWDGYVSGELFQSWLDLTQFTATPNRINVCDKFICLATIDEFRDSPSDCIQVYTRGINLKISKSKLLTPDVSGLKAWLSSNPTTVYYELATPIIAPILDNKEQVVLPNGVVDKWSEDKLINNVGKVVLGNGESWTWEKSNTTHAICYLTNGVTGKSECDIVNTDILSNNAEVRTNKYIADGSISGYNAGDAKKVLICSTTPVNQNEALRRSLAIAVPVSMLSTSNIAGFNKWISENPATVWFPLKTPVYKNIKNTPMRLKTYGTRTYLSSRSSIAPNLKVVSVGLRKKALIKANTTYQFKHIKSSTVNPITVDLGGTKKVLTASEYSSSITTPATLIHDELRITGYGIKVSNVMTTEGVSSCDYADGIGSFGDKCRNLFDGKYEFGTILTDGSEGVHTERKRSSNYIPVCPNTEYIFSSLPQHGGETNWIEYDENKKHIKNIGFTRSIRTSINCYYLRCYNAYVEDMNPSSFNDQIEEGTVATPYQEYYDGNDVVVESCGKNLFNKRMPYNEKYLNNDKCFGCYYDEASDLIISSGISGSVNSMFQYLKLKPNTKYTFSLEIVGWDQRFAIHNGVAQSEVSGVGPNSITVTTTVTGRLWVSILTKGSPNGIYGIRNLQITEVISPYTPYTSDTLKLRLPEPLRSLPNGVRDTIEKVNGEYVVVRRCGEVVLNSINTWHKSTAPDLNGTGEFTYFWTYQEIKDDGALDLNSNHAMSDNFISGPSYNGYLSNPKSFNYDFIHNSMASDKGIFLIAIQIRTSRLQTPSSDGLRQWISANPTTVIYKLKTPAMHPLNTKRLPNGVSDEVKDGKLVKKIGKVVLDGSESGWVVDSNPMYQTEGMLLFSGKVNPLANPINGDSNKNNILCESLSVRLPSTHLEAISSEGTYLGMKILKSKLSTLDIAGFKKWLSENPTTVWYELATPKELPYSSPNINIDTYDKVTNIYSKTSVAPIIDVEIPTSMGQVIKNDVERICKIEDNIDKLILPNLVEMDYRKTILEFDYSVSRMATKEE